MFHYWPRKVISRNVGGEGKRGGLLTPFEESDNDEENYGFNVLQLLSHFVNGDIEDDEPSLDLECLEMLKKLRACGLLQKEDIRTYRLLYCACHPSTQERFQYFLDWDSLALKEYRYEGNLLIHAVIVDRMYDIDCFTMMLKAGLEHYPTEMGFLAELANNGETTSELAFKEFGEKRTSGDH